MSSYEMAAGILGGGSLLAALLRTIPLLRRRRQIRRFRNALNQVDVVAMARAQPFGHGPHRQDGDARTEQSRRDD